jgi:lipopolysaccharide export system permease protein
LCLFFFLLYYLMLTAGYAFGENGTYPPVIGMWLPNLVMASIGLYYILQTAKERSLRMERRILSVYRFLFRFGQR